MNEIKTIKNLIPEEDQYKIIGKIIKEEFNNQKLIDALTRKLNEKGFSARIMTGVFGGDLKWADVPEIAKVAFVEGAKDGLDWEILDSDKWFEDSVLTVYDVKVNEAKITDSIVIKNMIKIDDFNLLGYAPIQDIFNWFNNTLLIYNYDAQRAPKFKEIGTKGKVIKTYWLNDKAVKEISKDIVDGIYEEDLLIYNVLLKNQNIVPQVSIVETVLPGIVDVEIIPNYDRKSKHYTIVNPLDGWHRTIAGVMAYSEALKKNIELKRGYPIKITMRDLKGSQRIVNQIFKRNDTNPQWLDSISNSDYNEFIELLVKSSNILKGKVVTTYDEYLSISSLTYSFILSSAVELYATNIPVNSKLQRKMIAEKMANIIDDLFEYLIMKYDSMENLIEQTRLANVNIFVGYIAIANKLRLMDNYEDVLIKIGDKLCSLTTENLEPLKLSYKDFSIKKVYEYFEKIAKEVISVE